MATHMATAMDTITVPRLPDILTDILMVQLKMNKKKNMIKTKKTTVMPTLSTVMPTLRKKNTVMPTPMMNLNMKKKPKMLT